MLLSVSTSPINTRLSDRDAIRIIHEAGFDAYDMSLTKMMYNKDDVFNGDNYIEEATALREYADGLGIVCNQAHAPYHSSCGEPKRDAEIFNLIVRSMEIASILGAKIIVVHPKQHLKYADYAEELFNLNVEFYRNLAVYAEKFGIKVAVENMWQDNTKTHAIVDSTCSRSWEFRKYVDAIDSEWVVACLDIGHVSLVDADITEFIHTLGKDRLKALHVHDTDYVDDSHTLPFIEKLDYDAIAKTLGEVGYEGDFTYEANSFFVNKPIELLPASYKFACEIGRYLINEIEKARK